MRLPWSNAPIPKSLSEICKNVPWMLTLVFDLGYIFAYFWKLCSHSKFVDIFLGIKCTTSDAPQNNSFDISSFVASILNVHGRSFPFAFQKYLSIFYELSIYCCRWRIFGGIFGTWKTHLFKQWWISIQKQLCKSIHIETTTYVLNSYWKFSI